MRLETIFEGVPDVELVKLLQACWEWYGAFRDNRAPRWLSIIGKSGTGKTHCATRLWEWASRKSDFSKARYIQRPIYWPEFMQELRGGRAFELRDDMKRWPVLFLDDVGAERDSTGFATEELNTLLGCRMDRWTLITSNLTMERMVEMDERIGSRLIRGENICVGVLTKDFGMRL
jgi:DNA replication protein DnaC